MIFHIGDIYTFWDRKQQKYLRFKVIELLDNSIEVLVEPEGEEKTFLLDDFHNQRYYLVLENNQYTVDLKHD